MIPNHHPHQDLLVSYVSGSLQEPVALVVATHLVYCPSCRRQVAQYEALGGLMLEELDPEPVPSQLARQIAAMPDETKVAKATSAPGRAQSAAGSLPEPLCSYVQGDLSSLRWRWRGNLREARLLENYPGFVTRLLRIRGGAPMPRHTHRGNELTLILEGGYRDEFGEYLRGDLATADPSVDHRPVANPGGECVCLAVVDAPLRLTGLGGRLLNFMLRH